jgi:hypothetical protein
MTQPEKLNHQGRFPKMKLWAWKWGATLRIGRMFFQVKRQRDELFSQRHDNKRLRILGLSAKCARGIPHER